MTPTDKHCEDLANKALRAICLTYDYALPVRLCPRKNWEWYDACEELSTLYPNCEWAEQFRIRVKKYQIKEKLDKI